MIVHVCVERGFNRNSPVFDSHNAPHVMATCAVYSEGVQESNFAALCSSNVTPTLS
jgi:hypothetical protein